MPQQDPVSGLLEMVNQQMSFGTQMIGQLAQGIFQLAFMPLQLVTSMGQSVTEGSGVFTAKMSTQELVDKNIFGAGT